MYPSLLNRTDSEGWTALMWAAERGHEAVVRLLLEKGTHIGIKDIGGETAISIAVSSRHEATVQRLLMEKGVDINAKNTIGETILMKAASLSHEAVTQLLLQQGADVKVQDKQGETALMKAAKWGNKAVIQLLLGQGADINVQDIFGWQVESAAVVDIHSKIVEDNTIPTRECYCPLVMCNRLWLCQLDKSRVDLRLL